MTFTENAGSLLLNKVLRESLSLHSPSNSRVPPPGCISNAIGSYNVKKRPFYCAAAITDCNPYLSNGVDDECVTCRLQDVHLPSFGWYEM